MPVRILHLVHQYPPDHLGGTELYTQSVTQALSKRDHEVAVFTRRNAEGSGTERRQEANVAVAVAWNGAMNPTQRFLTTFGNGKIEEAFDRVLAQFQPELVHIQHLMGLPTTLLDCLQRRHIPFVVTLHDFWWVCANAQLITNYSGEICNGPSLWINCARCALARSQSSALWPAMPALALMLARRGSVLNHMLGQAARLVAPSAFVKQWYVEHGVPEAQVQVLAHGIDCPAQATGSRGEERALRFFYAGGLSWQKGIHVLIEAFTAVEGPCELWIAGDESFDVEYSERLHAAASANVHFLGPLSRQQIWETLAQVDVVVVPALWYETFSLIVHEAFAAGVPVVTSRLGALAEAVRHEVDGFLVEPGNLADWQTTLQKLVESPAILAQLRRQIRPPMTVDEHVSRLLAIYADAIGTEIF